MLLIIILGQPSESWDCPRQSRTCCHPSHNARTGENLNGPRKLGEPDLALTLYQKSKVWLLRGVVQTGGGKGGMIRPAARKHSLGHHHLPVEVEELWGGGRGMATLRDAPLKP